MQVAHCNVAGCFIHHHWFRLGTSLLQTMCLLIVTCMCFVLPHAGCPLQRCGLPYTSPLVSTRDIFIANNVSVHCNLHVLCTTTCRLSIATLRVALHRLSTRRVFIANNVFAHCNLHVLCTTTCRLPIATLRVALYIASRLGVCSLRTMFLVIVTCMCFVLPHAGCPLQRCGLPYTSPFESAYVDCKQCFCLFILHVLRTATRGLPIATYQVALYIAFAFESS